MQHRVRAVRRLRQRRGFADIAAVDGHAAVLQPAGILAGQGEYPHQVAPVLQGGHEVPADEPVAAGDEYCAAHAGTAPITGTRPEARQASRYHSMLSLIPSASSDPRRESELAPGPGDREAVVAAQQLEPVAHHGRRLPPPRQAPEMLRCAAEHQAAP